MIGSELTIQLVMFRLVAGLIIATVHGATIAAAAVLLGDKGPRYDERLSLQPFRHVDLLGLGSIIVSGFGWSRPVGIDSAQMGAGRWGLVIAALAGSAALLVAAFALQFLITPALTLLPHTAGLTSAAFLRLTMRLCVWMALFSLLPLPPLAGAHLLGAAGIRLPAISGTVIGWALLVASAFGITRIVLSPLYNLVAPLVLGSQFAG